jgi:hypothetical protein
MVEIPYAASSGLSPRIPGTAVCAWVRANSPKTRHRDRPILPLLAMSENASLQMPHLSDRKLGCAWWSVTDKTGPARKVLMIGRFVARSALVLWSVVLVGCSGNTSRAGETVYLRNSTTGQVVACGPYQTTEPSGSTSASVERKCIEDYQGQGFVQVPVSE